MPASPWALLRMVRNRILCDLKKIQSKHGRQLCLNDTLVGQTLNAGFSSHSFNIDTLNLPVFYFRFVLHSCITAGVVPFISVDVFLKEGLWPHLKYLYYQLWWFHPDVQLNYYIILLLLLLKGRGGENEMKKGSGFEITVTDQWLWE